MHMTGSPVSPEQGESDRDNVVLRCERYREAFLLLLNAPFEDLDDSLMRMLAVLATTLDEPPRLSWRPFGLSQAALA